MNTPSAKILFKWKHYPHDRGVNATILLLHQYSPKKSYSKGYVTHEGRKLHTSWFRQYRSTPDDPYSLTTNTFIEQYYGDFRTLHH
ncbi:hypothetical protein C922_05405 [Plasmodium inui San Antonio 1]|uniref:Uncharacterized protein n=1 Tax=Plasmodium inui San Antonio 1 TaxID=1237626 RepID=W6ZY49_9APIC|nr:hypothetical protein C922_05405 [Plasmodium inui San Antonio 1]EUD64215.1 hypothetical protein C922_05405 [Plasmodium inui San Antonio 1]